ncbi:MAG: AMP-binding protein, partial [Chloroflexota bacterium]|nr:AMP-binding protein [Chloroflexota bacterium]
MVQSSPLAFLQPQVSVRQQGDDLIIENPTPLADCPDNLAAWLRLNAARFPDKLLIAQRDVQGEWRGPTWGEALAQVNRLTNGLLAHGMDGSRPLAIMSENSVEMALVQLAAMQVGIAVAPISYAYSTLSASGEYIKHILDVTGAPMVAMSDADIHMPKLRQWDLSGVALYAVSHAERHPGVRPLAALELGGDTLSPLGERR